MAVLVLGETAGLPLNMEEALWGAEVLRGKGPSSWPDRLPTGLFALGDDAGSVSRISAVVYIRLASHWNNLRVHSWMAENERAGTPLCREAARVLRQAFDRGAVLREELERVLTRLRERYDPERVIVFGSLGRDLRRDVRDAVHQWSDLDLAIVKATTKPYLERVREATALIEPRVEVNLLVFTPEEFEHLAGESPFVRDEIVGQGCQVHPARG
jgi:predicted nucleotidyltransferase